MSPQVKAALIIAGAIIVGISLWIFFSPFQTCMRAGRGGESTAVTTFACARVASGG